MELDYINGLFDIGVFHFSIHRIKNTNTYLFVVSIAHQDLEFLNILHKEFGGRLYHYKNIHRIIFQKRSDIKNLMEYLGSDPGTHNTKRKEQYKIFNEAFEFYQKYSKSGRKKSGGRRNPDFIFEKMDNYIANIKLETIKNE